MTLKSSGRAAVARGARFVGGRQRGLGKGRPDAFNKKKTPVFGMVERKGRVIALATPDVKKATVMKIIKEKVLPKSTIFTDDYVIYDDLAHHLNEYNHRRINHSAKVYVMGDVHTQTIEGFWSLIKRGIAGVYHSVSQKYLQSYLDEYSFRYNNRKDPRGVFNVWLSRVQKTREQASASE